MSLLRLIHKLVILQHVFHCLPRDDAEQRREVEVLRYLSGCASGGLRRYRVKDDGWTVGSGWRDGCVEYVD